MPLFCIIVLISTFGIIYTFFTVLILLFGIFYAFFYDQIKYMFDENIESNIESDIDTKITDEPRIESNITVHTTDIINEIIMVTYKGSKYDITDFIKKHPGGKDVLIEYNGKDIEQVMIENEHSAHAFSKLEKYKIE